MADIGCNVSIETPSGCDFANEDNGTDSNTSNFEIDQYEAFTGCRPANSSAQFRKLQISKSKSGEKENMYPDKKLPRSICHRNTRELSSQLKVGVAFQRRLSFGDLIEQPMMLTKVPRKFTKTRRGSTPNADLLPFRRGTADDHEESFEDILDYDETNQLSSALILTPCVDECLTVRSNKSKTFSWPIPTSSKDSNDDTFDQFEQVDYIKSPSALENDFGKSTSEKTNFRQLNIDPSVDLDNTMDSVKSKTLSIDYQQAKRMHAVRVIRRSNTLSDPKSFYQERIMTKSVWVNAFAETYDEDLDIGYSLLESWIYRLNLPLRHAATRLRRSFTERRRGNAHQRTSHAHQPSSHTHQIYHAYNQPDHAYSSRYFRPLSSKSNADGPTSNRQEKPTRNHFGVVDDVPRDLSVAESCDFGKNNVGCMVGPLITAVVPSENEDHQVSGSMTSKSATVTVTHADGGDSDRPHVSVPSDCVLVSSFGDDVTAEVSDLSGGVSPMYSSPHTVLKTVEQRNALDLKQDLRGGVWPLDAPCRRYLWLSLCMRLDSWSSSDQEQYTETVQQLEGEYASACQFHHRQPSFVHTFYCRHYHLLTSFGVARAERVLAVIHYCHPTITYSPTLYPLTALLLHYMNEEEAYCCLSALLRSRKVNFVVQTRCEFEIGWLTMISLSRKHTGSAVRHLSRSVAPGETMNSVLADWLAWTFCFLPFRHIVRIVDCYLVEGSKILYRAALALLLLLHRASVKGSSSWSKHLGTDSLQDVMEKFCRSIPHSPAKLLSTMFHVKGFSRSTLRSCHQSIRAKIRDNGGRLTFPERSGDRPVCGDDSVGGFPSVKSRDQLIDGSSTIAVRELLKLWDNLPQRYALYSPTLLYTSDEHGFSLKTFYSRVEHHEPTVLLLRTVCGAVLGAYCTASWATRNRLQEDGSRFTYFGTGEMFIFTLRPSFCLYPWVVRQKQQLSPSEPPPAPAHAEQLFMAGDSTMVAIGGGGGSGHAIWLDENLSRGKSDACLTFANPPLVDGGVFSVACMEAFGFSL